MFVQWCYVQSGILPVTASWHILSHSGTLQKIEHSSLLLPCLLLAQGTITLQVQGKKKRQTLNYLLRFPSEILLGWGEGVRIEPTRLSASLCFRLAHLLCNLDGLFPPFSLHFRSPVSLPFSYPISHTIPVLQLCRFILSSRGMLFRNWAEPGEQYNCWSQP